MSKIICLFALAGSTVVGFATGCGGNSAAVNPSPAALVVAPDAHCLSLRAFATAAASAERVRVSNRDFEVLAPADTVSEIFAHHYFSHQALELSHEFKLTAERARTGDAFGFRQLDCESLEIAAGPDKGTRLKLVDATSTHLKTEVLILGGPATTVAPDAGRRYFFEATLESPQHLRVEHAESVEASVGEKDCDFTFERHNVRIVDEIEFAAMGIPFTPTGEPTVRLRDYRKLATAYWTPVRREQFEKRIRNVGECFRR